MAFIRFVLLFISFFIGSLQAYETADIRFEVETLGNKRLTLKAFERSTPLFTQTVGPSFNSALVMGQWTLGRHGKGYKLLYKGRDETFLNLEVDAEGNIFLENSDEHTGFAAHKTWGFKTSATINHAGTSLFYKLYTKAKSFHNHGLLKAYTGELLQDYLFNRGIVHFGDEADYVGWEAYDANYLKRQNPHANPAFQNGLIDDHGVILADQGLTITGLTHRIQGLVDVGQGGLELKDASIDNRNSLNVDGPIRGTINHFNNQGVFTADTIQSRDLTIQSWTNRGQVYLSQGSDIYAQEKWNNSGEIHIRGNATVRSKKKPEALGAVISDGVIKTLIDEAFDEASFKALFTTAAFFSDKRKVLINRLQHTDHYLNTITLHYTVDRWGNKTYTRTTETGDVFQNRTTKRMPAEIEVEGPPTPDAVKKVTQGLQKQQNFLQALKQSLKDGLKKRGLIHANHNGILTALIKGLGEAGLSEEDISEIFSQNDIQIFVGLASAYDQSALEGQRNLQSDLPEVGSFLNRITSQAQSLRIPVWQWVQRNGFEFVDGFCNTVILASRFTPHPFVAVPARLCTFGQMAPKAIQNLQKAHTFFSKKHEGKVGERGGQSTLAPSKENQNLLWSSWKDYPKTIKNGKEYAKIGERYYTRHAVDRMQPSGLGVRVGGDKGRSFPPNLVDKVIRNGEKRIVTKDGKERAIHSMGSAEVITEESGHIVVTVNPFRGGY